MKNENTALEKRRKELELVSGMINGSPFTPEQIGVIQKSVAKGTEVAELAYFLNVCQSVGLNPFNKEVWCYKDHRGNLIIFTGRDGLLRKAQENPNFGGIRSSEVREKDHFLIDIANAKIEHRFGLEDRGNIIGAYCIVDRKDGTPTIEFVKASEYMPKNPNPYTPWAKFPAAMMKKVAESHALKKAFGMSGVQIEYDFEVRDGVARPRGIEPKKRPNHEYNQLKRFIETCTPMELAGMDYSRLEPYEDLQAMYDERMTEELVAESYKAQKEAEDEEIQD